MSSPAKVVPEPLTFTRDLGAILTPHGVQYTIWAPEHELASVHIRPPADIARRLDLTKVEGGYFTALDPAGKAGDNYKIALDGGEPLPDLATRYQPEGVDGPSQVVDTAPFEWKADWERPKWNGKVVYEVHIGTFTKEGTWRAAIDKLAHVKSLGVTAIEIMPVAECSGRWNWGYDGVMLFAPNHNYGTPDDMRAFVDACHEQGLAVILDIVYNHIGPVGDYTDRYSMHFCFHEAYGPWGKGWNLDGKDCEPVRHMILQNIRYWLADFYIDGFRMDATHAIKDDSSNHILREVSQIVHQAGGFLIAEDERNSASVMEASELGGWHFDGVWADDFHHTARVSQTGERESYYISYQGNAAEIVETVRNGWLYRGQFHERFGGSRGTECIQFRPEQFVYCISNHDQVGNRALGERLHELVEPEAYRALSLLLCMVPYTPMLFMGQEWAASTPFLYFTDHPGDVGKAVTEGRKREFMDTGLNSDPDVVKRMPDPQDEKTFTQCKLDWSDLKKAPHQKMLELYSDGLKLRRELFGDGNPARDTWNVRAEGDAVILVYNFPDRKIVVYYLVKPMPLTIPKEAKLLIRSNSTQYDGVELASKPETLVFELPV